MGEPALVQVLENVKLARDAPSIIQHSPAYDPQVNGAAEKAVQDYMGQERAMNIGLEARLKCKVESDWNIMEWITEFAGELLSRGQFGKDGRTACFICTAGTAPRLRGHWRRECCDPRQNPARDRWNVNVVKAMQACLRVPNPENLRQARVMYNV